MNTFIAAMKSGFMPDKPSQRTCDRIDAALREVEEKAK